MNMRRLAELPLFQGLDERALQTIGRAVRENSVEEGRVLVREGDYSDVVTIIDEGTARVEHEGEVVAELGPGDVFGEAGLIGKSQRNANVVAATDMRLITLDTFDVNRLSGEHPQLKARLQELSASRS